MPALLPICWVGIVIALVVLFIVVNNKVKREEEERKRKEKERRRKEEEARRERVRKHNEKMRKKYESETPARRALIRQLYKEGLDLKEITFILRKAGYLGVTGEKITMKEIMEEYAQIQIDQHQKTLGKGTEP